MIFPTGTNIFHMNDTITIFNKLVGFSTTADEPEEIKKGFGYISSLFDLKKFEIQNFEKNGKHSQLISFRGKDALRPQVLLNGHFDVVPSKDKSQYRIKIEGKKAFGRGTLDMKGMLAVLIDVMKELGKKENPPNVALLITGDEEIGGENGVGFLVREIKLRPKFVLCADGGSEKPFELISKEKGGVWIELKAEGRAAHAAYLWLGENALDRILEAIVKIKKFVGPMKPDAWKSTVNVARIETSNETPNKVPSDARAVLDIRFTEQLAKNPKELTEKISSLVPEVRVRALSKVSLLFAEQQNPFLREFKKIAEEVLQKKVSFTHAHGATDARYFGEVGIPTAIFGAQGQGMHADKEFVNLESLKTNRKILIQFLQNNDR